MTIKNSYKLNIFKSRNTDCHSSEVNGAFWHFMHLDDWIRQWNRENNKP